MRFRHHPLLQARWLMLVRQWHQVWIGWRQAGVLLMGLYVGGFLVVALISLWQTYRFPTPDLGADVYAAGLSIWLLSMGLARRPALGLEGNDLPFIRWPAAPWKVLLWPLLRAVGRSAVPAGTLGVLCGLWFPALWPVGLSLPVFAAGRVVGQALIYDGRLLRDGKTPGMAVFLALLPLLGAVKLALLPLLAAAQLIGLLTLWRRFWQTTWHAVPLRHAEVQGLRLGAQRFGLPLPILGPDGFPPNRRLRVRPWGQGPWQAALWRSALHVLRQPAPLMLAPLVGLVAATGTPVLLALAVSPLLALLGPPALPGYPLPNYMVKLARTLPGGLLLGVLVGLGGLAGTLLGWVSPGWVAALIALPWSALSCSALIGEAVPGSTTPTSQLRFGAAMAPALAAFLCLASGATLLTPLIVGGVGILATFIPSTT